MRTIYTIYLFLLVFNLLFLTGYIFSCILSSKLELTEDELICSGPVLSLCFTGASGFVFHLLKIDASKYIALFIIYSALIFNIIFCLKNKSILASLFKNTLFKYYLCLIIHLLFIAMILPVYIGGFWWGDWKHHFDMAAAYLPDGNLTLSYIGRTPLYNLISAFFMNAFGKQFWIHQIVCILLNSVSFLSLSLLASRLFGRHLLSILFVFIFFNSWTLHQMWYPWTKSFTSYFTILSFYFYLWCRERYINCDSIDIKSFIISAAAAAAGYMAHPLALFYIFGILIDINIIAFVKKQRLKGIKYSSYYILCLIIISLPFYIYLLSMWEIGQVINASPAVSFNYNPEQFNHWYNIIIGRLINAVFSFIPYTLPHLFLSGHENFSFEKFFEYYTDLHYNPVMGAVTLTVTFILFVYMVKYLSDVENFKRIRQNYFIYRGNIITGLLSVIFLFCGIYLNRIIDYFSNGLPVNLFDYFSSREKILIQRVFFIIGAISIVIWLYGKIYKKANITLSNGGKIIDYYLNKKNFSVLIVLFTVYTLGILSHRGVIIPHGIAQSSLVQMVFIIFIYISQFISSMSCKFQLFVMSGILIEYISVSWVHKYLLITETMWKVDPNYLLKREGNILFIKDYIDSGWIVCVIFAVILDIIVAVWFLNRSAVFETD